VIPAAITGEFGIQMDHYLEVILHNIIKEGKLIPVYPGEMVEHEVRKTLVEPSR
jgi:hypothetical protein